MSAWALREYSSPSGTNSVGSTSAAYRLNWLANAENEGLLSSAASMVAMLAVNRMRSSTPRLRKSGSALGMRFCSIIAIS